MGGDGEADGGVDCGGAGDGGDDGVGDVCEEYASVVASGGVDDDDHGGVDDDDDACFASFVFPIPQQQQNRLQQQS